MKNLAIKAENISKQYRLGEVGTGTISHDLNRFWSKVRGKEDPYLRIGESNDRTSTGGSDYVWSLKDINFEIEQGDAVGIIGRNGAGKSTLLKLLSKVTKPTTGSFKVNGRVASLLEVGTGFNPEMTGKENIYMNGAILGMRRHEIDRKFDEIVDFSGVEKYINTPVKRYSSGMYVRLAFAVAAHLESEILIVDEVLAVGDAEFQKKCLGKMGDVSKGEGRTVLFVSHNMGAVKKLCNNAILLANGELVQKGSIEQIIQTYQEVKMIKEDYFSPTNTKDLYIKHVEICSDGNEFYCNQDISFKFEIASKLVDLKNKFLIIRFLDNLEQVLFSTEIGIENGKYIYNLTIPKETFVKGNYAINCIIYQPGSYPCDVINMCCPFTVLDNVIQFSHLETFDIGNLYARSEWK